MSFRTALLLIALSATVCHGQQNYPPAIPDAEEVVYKTVGDARLKMWVFEAAKDGDDASPRPAVVFFFGGGWKKGTPGQFESHCRYLASRGIVSVTADYRVAERHGVKADSCVEDAKSAVRFLRQHADRFGIDVDRICAGGGSAGGHIACCTALTDKPDAHAADSGVSSVPNALALFNPAVMLAQLDGFDASGIDDEKFAEIATRTGIEPERISPIHHVRSGLPPTIIFHGTADAAVPFATVAEFSRRSNLAGNRCELKAYSQAPHGFFNAPGSNLESVQQDLRRHWYHRTLAELDQFLQSLGWLEGPCPLPCSDHDFVYLRSLPISSFCRFSEEKEGHVAFLGGSITQMEGYRPRIADWLQQRFPDCKFNFTNAGISSTCSTTGACRLERDVLSQGPTDLLFVEFAVNDDQDAGHTADDCVRGMEGIIRQTLKHNPRANIVMTHFINPGMLTSLKNGENILTATEHEKVARAYNVSSVYLSKIVADRISQGTLTWKRFGGTHPGPEGNQLAADMAVSVLESGWRAFTRSGHDCEGSIPPADISEIAPLKKNSYSRGTLVPLKAATTDSAWSVSEPNWNAIGGGKRQQFLGVPLIHSDQVGATLKLHFHGTAVGAFVLAGPDAGQVEVRIDNGEWQTVDLYHRFSRGLHYPRTVMFANTLPDAPHQLTLRIAPQDKAERGTAVRILHPVVNGHVSP